MQYPEEFKEEVLKTLGDSEEMRRLLDIGHDIIGRYLDDSRHGSFSAEEIVAACESLNLQDLYQKAKKQVAIRKLYNEWSTLYHQQRQGTHK